MRRILQLFYLDFNCGDLKAKLAASHASFPQDRDPFHFCIVFVPDTVSKMHCVPCPIEPFGFPYNLLKPDPVIQSWISAGMGIKMCWSTLIFLAYVEISKSLHPSSIQAPSLLRPLLFRSVGKGICHRGASTDSDLLRKPGILALKAESVGQEVESSGNYSGQT